MTQQFSSRYITQETLRPMSTQKLEHSSIVILNSQKVKQPKCLLMDKWINGTWSIHAMGYYSGIKINKVLIQHK